MRKNVLSQWGTRGGTCALVIKTVTALSMPGLADTPSCKTIIKVFLLLYFARLGDQSLSLDRCAYFSQLLK
jgi:hypothetical protein